MIIELISIMYMVKVFICLTSDDNWREYEMVCKKAGEKDGMNILHPIDNDKFSSIRIPDDRVPDDGEVACVLKDDGKLDNKYTIERMRWWSEEYVVELYGSSDDLIELTGSVREEFYANYSEPTKVKINDCVVEVQYDGDWCFEVLESGDCWSQKKYGVNSPVSDKYKEYSELLCLGFTNPIRDVKKIED